MVVLTCHRFLLLPYSNFLDSRTVFLLDFWVFYLHWNHRSCLGRLGLEYRVVLLHRFWILPPCLPAFWVGACLGGAWAWVLPDAWNQHCLQITTRFWVLDSCRSGSCLPACRYRSGLPVDTWNRLGAWVGGLRSRFCLRSAVCSGGRFLPQILWVPACLLPYHLRLLPGCLLPPATVSPGLGADCCLPGMGLRFTVSACSPLPPAFCLLGACRNLPFTCQFLGAACHHGWRVTPACLGHVSWVPGSAFLLPYFLPPGCSLRSATAGTCGTCLPFLPYSGFLGLLGLPFCRFCLPACSGFCTAGFWVLPAVLPVSAWIFCLPAGLCLDAALDSGFSAWVVTCHHLPAWVWVDFWVLEHTFLLPVLPGCLPAVGVPRFWVIFCTTAFSTCWYRFWNSLGGPPPGSCTRSRYHSGFTCVLGLGSGFTWVLGLGCRYCHLPACHRPRFCIWECLQVTTCSGMPACRSTGCLLEACIFWEGLEVPFCLHHLPFLPGWACKLPAVSLPAFTFYLDGSFGYHTVFYGALLPFCLPACTVSGFLHQIGACHRFLPPPACRYSFRSGSLRSHWVDFCLDTTTIYLGSSAFLPWVLGSAGFLPATVLPAVLGDSRFWRGGLGILFWVLLPFLWVLSCLGSHYWFLGFCLGLGPGVLGLWVWVLDPAFCRSGLPGSAAACTACRAGGCY